MVSLGCAIDAYIAKDDTLTKAEREMLARLRASKETPDEFTALGLSDAKGFWLIHDCVVAYGYVRGEHKREVELYRSAPDPKKARAALAELERFFQGAVFLSIPKPLDLSPRPPNWDEYQKSPRPFIQGPDRCPQADAIAVLAQSIDDAERLHKEYRARISRKGDKVAARSRAIDWIKKSVSRLSGRPNLEAVRTIASAVLGQDLTSDDLKNAISPNERKMRVRGK